MKCLVPKVAEILGLALQLELEQDEEGVRSKNPQTAMTSESPPNMTSTKISTDTLYDEFSATNQQNCIIFCE